MLLFDPQTYSSWKTEDIKNISIEFVSSGCEGTTIQIHKNTILTDYVFIENKENAISIYCPIKHKEILGSSYITHTGSKWILKSEGILTRCGCGKSFGIKTGDIKIDKIKLLRSKLAKNKGTHHS